MSALLKYMRLSNLFKLSKLNTNFQVAYLHMPTRQHSSILVRFSDIVERQRPLPKLQQRQIPCVCQYCTEPTVAGSASSSPALDFSIDALLPNKTATPWRPPSKLETLMLHLQYIQNGNFILKLRDFRDAVDAALVEDVSVRNALTLLIISSHPTLPLSVEQKCEIVEKLWQRYKDLGLHQNTVLFNERLMAYARVNRLDRLSVIDMLSDMEQLAITPNHATYSMFLRMYCTAGDMSSASEVLQHMKNMDMNVDILQYNYLIHGHFVAGDTRTAIELFTSVQDRGLQVNRYSHGEMLVGFARTGNTASIEKMMSDPIFNRIPLHFYKDAIIMLAKQGHKELADKILTATLQRYANSNNKAMVIEFLEAGLLDYAIAVHNRPDAFRDFSTFVCSADLSVDDMVRCLRKVKELHPESNARVYFHMFNLQYLDRPGRMIDFLTAMGKMGEKIEPTLYRVPIKQFTDKMDVEGLCEAVPKIMTALSPNQEQQENIVEILPLLVDAFRGMGKSADEIASLFKQHAPHFQRPHVNFLLIQQFADHSLETAIKFVNNVDKIVTTVVPQRNLYHLLRADFLPNNWKDVYTLIEAISRKVPQILFDTGLFLPTVRMMKKDNINPEPLLNFLLDKKLKLHLKIDIETVLPEIPEEMKERIRKELIVVQTLPKDAGESAKLFSELMKHVNNKNFEALHKLEEDIQRRELSVSSLRIAHLMAKFHAMETKMPEKAWEYLLEYERIRTEKHGNSRDHCLQPNLTLQVAGLFAQDGMLDRAISVLGTLPVDQLINEFQYFGNISKNLASVILLCESEQQLSNLIQSIYKNGYFRCKPGMRDFIWKCFFQNVTDRENPEELGRAVDFMCDHPSNAQPYVMHSLFRSLIAQKNQDGVTLVGQKVKQHLKQKGSNDSDITVLNMLTTAFMEEEKLEIATSIVETPGFIPHRNYLAWYCIYCAKNGQPSKMETIYHLMKNNNETVPKDQLLFFCVKAYCNVYPKQLDAARRVLDTVYREEGVYPSSRTTSYMMNVNNPRPKSETERSEASTPTDVAQSCFHMTDGTAIYKVYGEIIKDSNDVGRVSQIEEEKDEVSSKLNAMKPHVPGIVIFADHNRALPWSVTYHAVVMFADISGFTALCEKYSSMGQLGVDQLTRTLNAYLSALVEGILGSDGDVIKFAGDAILAIWRVGREEELQTELMKVVQCCLDIQAKCGEWDTDIGVKLTVKIGVSAGEMTITFLGNQEYRHYVELGPAVTAVNMAEKFCQSGYVVLSPGAWEACLQRRYEAEPTGDFSHVRIHAILPQRQRSLSLPIPHLDFRQSARRGSLVGKESKDDLAVDTHGASLLSKSERSTIPTSTATPASPILPSIAAPTTPLEESCQAPTTVAKPEKSFTMIGVATTKIKMGKLGAKLGGKFGKLRKVVETVTEMRLDLALRWYILPPVLKKMDDDQPLEYLSEMRVVSVIFMNLIIEDSGDTQELLQRIFELVYSQSIAMHGCLNKVFLFDKGCTFLVLFGLPGYKHEQDCAHALICSGRMKKRLEKIAGVQLVSIGVTTGTTFCGVVGHPSRHEYSVIGRKVNMAARLMMHYPGKVTCDTTTFQTCRLPPAHFEVLITKRMKGLRNVGVIREFIGHTKEEEIVAKSIRHSDFPILGRQVEELLFHQQLALMEKTEKSSTRWKHLIFSGASGLGKTKLLDHIIGISEGRQFKVISCRIDLEDSSYPYFVANHILRTLLVNIGFSHQIDKEPMIMEAIGEDNACYMYLLNDVLGSTLEKPLYLSKQNICESTKRHELLSIIARVCLVAEKDTVVVIDDAHNIDTSSWKFMCELAAIDAALIVLGLRPSIIEKPSCRDAANFIDNPDVKLFDMTCLDHKYIAPLACQMMGVVVIPKELDTLLRERSHGVPSWCLELLKDMLDKKQLVVVQDDGSSKLRQSTVAPNRLLIKPVTSDHLTENEDKHALRVSLTELHMSPSTEGVSSDSERTILQNMGYATTAAPPSMLMDRNPMEDVSGGAMSTTEERTVNSPQIPRLTKLTRINKGRADRIAVFASGRKASDIPVADSMKELIIARLDSMRSTDQLMVKCAAVLGMTVRRDILEMLLPKAHRPKLAASIRRLMDSGIFQCASAPSSHVAKISGVMEEGGNFKYKCYCPKEVTITRPGEPKSCFEVRFTNNLLQQTSYNVLLEAQRIELHAKAAYYFDLAADEVRHYVPYYVLERPPPDYLQEALQNSEDVFTPVKIRSSGTRSNKVSDENYAKFAAEAKARRGRRQAVAIAAEDAVALGHRIVEGAKPIERITHYIEILLPIYDSLCEHWKQSRKPRNVISTLLEATAAALFLKRNATALVMIRRTEEMLEEQQLDDSMENQVLRAKVYRLYGKILYKSGDISQASEYLSKCAGILGLKQPKNPEKYRVFTARLRASFFMFWRLKVRRTRAADLLTLEQGYCLADMYAMDRQIGNRDLQLMHALQQFSKIAGWTLHLHQVVTAYSSLIECARERDWLDLANRLEDELLRGCAARHEELSTEDRSSVARIYATRSIQFFNAGQLDKADNAGRTAAEICTCIQDQRTVKMFAPYYFFLCLNKKVYVNCVDLLEQLRFSATLTDDKMAKAMYHTFCLEVAMAGGCPPETIQNCMAYITTYLRTCDAVANEIAKRFYFAMTAALWCARQEEWSRVQVWFDYWEMYEMDDGSLFFLLALTNKLECMLHSFSKASEIGNKAVAMDLRQQITKDFHMCMKKIKRYPVIIPRIGHLRSYFGVLTGHSILARKTLSSAKRTAKKHGNLFEVQWMRHNKQMWFSKPYNETFNNDWKDVTNQHFTDWKLISGLRGDVYRYTLPLPVTTCTQ